MSIAPPSDIILDVAQAADPLKLQAATSKLARAAATGANSFDAALASSGTAPAMAAPGTRPVLLPVATGGLARLPLESKQTTTDRKFEAMVLQNFIENIMPKDPELFGNKESADMCRTLMAEQIANQIARTGAIGIAKSLHRFQDAAQQSNAAPLPLTLPGARHV